MNDIIVCDDTIWVTERNASIITGEGNRWIYGGAHLHKDCPSLTKCSCGGVTGLLGKINYDAYYGPAFLYGMHRLHVADICKGCLAWKKREDKAAQHRGIPVSDWIAGNKNLKHSVDILNARLEKIYERAGDALAAAKRNYPYPSDEAAALAEIQALTQWIPGEKP